MANDRCVEHDRLTKEAHEQLRKLNELTTRQLEAFDSGDRARFMKVDQQVELALGEKERRIGALRQHDDEHGCQGQQTGG
jgi:hypothetical protein